MAATISINQQQLELTEVGDVVISDLVADPDFGGWVRTISVYNDTSSNPTVTTLMVQLKIRSVTKTNLDITSPSSEF